MKSKYGIRVTYCHKTHHQISIDCLIKQMNNIRNNKYNGETKYWYANKHPLSIEHYKDGKKDGEYIYYLKDGKIFIHQIYDNGKLIKEV